MPTLYPDECRCEHISHVEPCNCTIDLEDVCTIYGTFRICKRCRDSHPIPVEYLKTKD